MRKHAHVLCGAVLALGWVTTARGATQVVSSHVARPPKADVPWDDFGFSLNGVRTSWMYRCTWSEGSGGWTGGLMEHGALSIEPSATVLNYGQALFEGLKVRKALSPWSREAQLLFTPSRPFCASCRPRSQAMRRPDGSIMIFRPEMNARRMAAGADRFCMPSVPEDLFLRAVDEVVRANSEWVPPLGKGALYLRPVLFGSGAALGVGPSPEVTFVIFCSPVGTYFKKLKHPEQGAAAPEGDGDDSRGTTSGEGQGTGGVEEEDEGEMFSLPPPINLWVTPRYHRAAEGGVGGVKASGNYAPCFEASRRAKAAGYNEVLFLDSKTDSVVEEAGASNFFAVFGNRLRTPDIGRGTILPGVTRASILQLAAELGMEVEEGPLSLEALKDADEVFCCGTGACITPVASVTCEALADQARDASTDPEPSGAPRGPSMHFPAGPGPVTQKLASLFSGIWSGHLADNHGWLREVCKSPDEAQ